MGEGLNEGLMREGKLIAKMMSEGTMNERDE